VIEGTAPATARVGASYTFTPTVLDADGDDLLFTATGLPQWAELDPFSGKLTGVPHAGDEGRHRGITIRVTDGRSSAELPAFSIDVSQHADGRALLSWTAPTERANGTPLTDLAGFRIDYGRDRGDPDHHLLITNPSINTIQIDNLSSGRWHFAVVAFDEQSIESRPSALASQTIN
jgi:hypothetical protein